MWKKQQQVHWMPEEVPLGEDMKDWAVNLSDSERNLLTQIFRFFTQADIEVQDNYMEKYGRVFKPTEVKMMLASFANMETIHIAAYALLLETIGMPESEFAAFLEYEAMRDKHDFMQKFGVETNADIARTLAMFGGFAEGLQLFASFAMLMNFPRFRQDEGHGPDRQLVGAGREPALRRHHQALPRLQQGDRRGHPGGRRRHRRLLPDRGRDGRQVHRPGLRDGSRSRA
jgi:ribonucleoside-diphosphate reductase beta chain